MCVVCPCIGAAAKSSIDSCESLVHTYRMANPLELTIDAVSKRETPCEVLWTRPDAGDDVLTWIRRRTVSVIPTKVSIFLSGKDFMARARRDIGTWPFWKMTLVLSLVPIWFSRAAKMAKRRGGSYCRRRGGHAVRCTDDANTNSNRGSRSGRKITIEHEPAGRCRWKRYERVPLTLQRQWPSPVVKPRRWPEHPCPSRRSIRAGDPTRPSPCGHASARWTTSSLGITNTGGRESVNSGPVEMRNKT